MHRLEGTDFFYRTYELGSRGRIDYRFQIDFGDAVADPRNPRNVPAPWDDIGFSEVSLSGDPEPSFLAEPSGARGRLEKVPFPSELLGNEREITLYLPAGYDDSEERYPLLFVAEGDQWMEKGLMVNALDSCEGRAGRIVLDFAVDERSVRVLVQDDGCGIEPEIRPHLFQPFQTRKRGGTGLGLFLSRSFMRRFGGDVRLLRSVPGEGSCFEVSFARIEVEEE